MYKERLKKLAGEDEREFPGQIVLEDVVVKVAASQVEKSQDDFFSEMMGSSSAAPAAVQPQTRVVRRLSFGTATLPDLAAVKPEPVVEKEVFVEKVVEKPLFAPQRSFEATPTSSFSSSHGGGGYTGKTSGKKSLGAKKASKAINFDEAERKAKIEDQRRVAEEQEKKQRELDVRTQRATSSTSRPTQSSNRTGPSSNGATLAEADDGMMDRLGMGFGSMGGGGFAPAAKEKKAAKPPTSTGGFGGFGGFGNSGYGGEEETDSGDATTRFTSAKAISSDQYFNRGQFDEKAGYEIGIYLIPSAEARERLQDFQGKSGFGSADYYQRDESGGAGERRGSIEGVGESAREFAQKFVGQAADDLSTLREFVGNGSVKLGEMLQDMQQRYN
jgi:hypothetical protein